MKLLFCPDCGDVVQLRSAIRSCSCKAVEGRYVNDQLVEVTGERAEVLGMDSYSIQAGLTLVDVSEKRGPTIVAWMFPHGAEHVRRLGRKR